MLQIYTKFIEIFITETDERAPAKLCIKAPGCIKVREAGFVHCESKLL